MGENPDKKGEMVNRGNMYERRKRTELWRDNDLVQKVGGEEVLQYGDSNARTGTDKKAAEEAGISKDEVVNRGGKDNTK